MTGLNNARAYARRFFYEARYVGIKSALRLALLKTGRTVRSWGNTKSDIPGFQETTKTQKVSWVSEIENIPAQGSPKLNLVMIISDTRIEQCITYRINQKMDTLNDIGYSTILLSTNNIGLILSYLPLCDIIVIYRTSIPDVLMEKIKSSQSRLLFEFDDLVVAPAIVRRSGIMGSLSYQESVGLIGESASLWRTAKECKEWLVSSEYIKRTYDNYNNKKMKDAPIIQVLPNYIIEYPAIRRKNKRYDFAFTSPSTSIAPEIGMVAEFLRGYAEARAGKVKVLIIGNDLVFERLLNSDGIYGEYFREEFVGYTDYVETLSSARYNCIPLSDSLFNHGKTAIRGFDCAVAGVLPLVSPIGEYARYLEDESLRNLVAVNNNWSALGGRIARLSESYDQLLAAFTAYARANSGSDEAESRYRAVFPS